MGPFGHRADMTFQKEPVAAKSDHGVLRWTIRICMNF